MAKEGAGEGVHDAEEVAKVADVIFYCVGDTEMAREMTLGPKGLLEGVRKGSIVRRLQHDFSGGEQGDRKQAVRWITEPHFLRRALYRIEARSGKGDADVHGGGEQRVFERAKPYFEIMGKVFYYCGAAGQGLQAKLTQNLILAEYHAGVRGGMVLATKGGIPLSLNARILDNSAAKSGLSRSKHRTSCHGTSGRTSLRNGCTGRRTGARIAKEPGGPLPVTANDRADVTRNMASGRADDDFCSVIRGFGKTGLKWK